MRTCCFLILILVFACTSKENAEIETSKAIRLIENNPPINDSIYQENLKIFAPSFPFTNVSVGLFKNSPKDKDGIHLYNYGGENRYYSVAYTQAALFYYNHFMKTNDENSKIIFLKTADYIKGNAKTVNNYAVLQNNFIIEPYQFTLPASSSVAQSYGIGTMIQAYSLTKDIEYLKTAEKFVNSYGITIERGGIRSNWHGHPFYEEFPDPNSHVLSGHLTSLAGLYYAYETTGNQTAKRYFDEGVETLKIKIRDFDIEFTSLYSKMNYNKNPYTFASAIGEDPDYYHELQISQLLLLYLWTKEEAFKDYAHRFLKQDMGEMGTLSNNSKFKKITSSYTTDPKKLGVNHLDDELWSWGKYWSTNKFPTELKIEFNEEKKEITAISFFSIKGDAAPKNFIISVLQDGKWNEIYESSQIQMLNQNYYKTGNFETFIDTYYLPKSVDGHGLKITFTDSRPSEIIALREINILFDRGKEIERILQKIITENKNLNATK